MHLLFLLIANVIVWVAVRGLTDANLDSYGDMLENVAWAQVFELGTFKHPPLFAWVTGAWFAALPYSDSDYHLLAYLNVAVGLLGVFHLAKALGRPVFALPAVMLLAMAFPYNTLAAKFNANAILLSVWPWVAVAMLKSVTLDKLPGMVWSITLGVLAALAMLGKYYSGVLLLGLSLAMLTERSGRDWLKTPRPWIALATFMVCMIPHVEWVAGHGWVTLRYMAEQGEGHTDWKQVLQFALAPLMYWCVPWLMCCIVFAEPQSRWSGLMGRLLKSWQPTDWTDRLFWIALSPWLITLFFGISGFVDLSLPWAIPIGFAFSLLWLRNLCPSGQEAWLSASSHQIHRGFLYFLGLVLLASPFWAGWQAVRGDTKYYLPREAAAQEITRAWGQRYPNQALHWVGGKWGENAMMAFYGQRDLRIIPGYPNQYPAIVSPYPLWPAKAGLLLCPLGRVPAGQSGPVTTLDACMNDSVKWLAQQGQATEPFLIRVHRQGWRFPLVVEFAYAVFPYLPPSPQ